MSYERRRPTSRRARHRDSYDARIQEGVQAAYALAQAAQQEEANGNVPTGKQKGAVRKGDFALVPAPTGFPAYDPVHRFGDPFMFNGRLYQDSGLHLGGNYWAIWEERQDSSRTLSSWAFHGIGWSFEGVFNESDDPNEVDAKDPRVSGALERLYQAVKALHASQSKCLSR